MTCSAQRAFTFLFLLSQWAGTLYAEERPEQVNPRPQLRVLTYNIHHGEGRDGKVDYQRLARIIKDQNPDVVALQEVDNQTARSAGVDQAGHLGELTGLHHAFGNAMHFSGGQYGGAILSRFPISQIKNHPLPFPFGHESRSVLAVQVSPDNGLPAFTFAGTHFCHQGSECREGQALHINSLFLNQDDQPVVLAGDMNARPGSEAMEILLKEGWVDAIAPKSRIDYVLYRKRDAWKVVDVQILDEPIASDHLPVLAVLEWQGNQVPGVDQEAAASPASPRTLKVISYNILEGFETDKTMSDGVSRKQAVADWLKHQQPDIVGFQELNGYSEKKLKTEAGKWGHAYAQINKTGGYIVGITSRYPLEVIEKRTRDMHHGLIHVRTAGVDVVVTHFSPFKWKVRNVEAQIVADKVQSCHEQNRRVIVMGDLNARSADDAKWIREEYIQRRQASDLRHAHVQNLENGAVSFTCLNTLLESGLSDVYIPWLDTALVENHSRIDYILASEELARKATKATWLVEPGFREYSDHYPVVAEFEWQIPGEPDQ